MNRLLKITSSLLGLFFYFFVHGQEPLELNIIFYNVENLFDVYDDSLSLDDEFLPHGARGWSQKRFEIKRDNIAKVILSSCGFRQPEIIGMAEVENRYVLEQLVEKSPLKPLSYKIIHKDSPDERGIDVALIYRSDVVTPIYYQYIPLIDNDMLMLTREILYAAFTISAGDTMHIFFNHWPSRYQGQAATEPHRILAAQTLRKKIDELILKHHNPYIVIMGDLNDQPENKSIKSLLSSDLLNLSSGWKNMGTLKYRQTWQIFDHIIVSKSLHKSYNVEGTIVSSNFLLEPDPQFKGKRLNRTYIGYRYHGGFSDHLPVRLKITDK